MDDIWEVPESGRIRIYFMKGTFDCSHAPYANSPSSFNLIRDISPPINVAHDNDAPESGSWDIVL